MNADAFQRIANPPVMDDGRETRGGRPHQGGQQQGRQQRGRQPEAPVTDRLHPGVLKIMAGCFIVMMLAFWAVFRNSSEAAFMVVISAVYLAMYLGTPLVMLRVNQHHTPEAEHGSFADFLDHRMETATGTITGREVVLQACSIPVALALATIGICVVIATSP